MSTLYKSFLENFPDEFSIAHKIAPQTEKKTFHMHKQLEVIYTISSNMKCRTEKGIRSIPKNSLVLLNSMDLHYFFTDPGSGLCDRYVLYFSSNMKCRTEKGIRSIPKNSLVLLNSMDLHYFFTDPGSGLCDRYVLYFSPSFISPLSTQEVNLLESFNVSRMEHPIILSAPECQQIHWLYLMDQMISQLKLVNSASPCQDSFGTVLHIKFLLGQFLLMVNQLYWQSYGMDQMISQLKLVNSASPCQDSFGTVLHIKFLLGQFLLMVNQLYWQSYGNVQSALYKNHSHLVMEICEFIHSHIQCPISADSLADHFHISKTQLYYLFKEVLGTTAGDFLIECRMTCAKNYLINSEYSVEMISELVGYHNLSSLFKEVLGTTAGDFLIECRMTCAKNYLINSEYSVEMISELVGYHNLSSFSRTFKALSDCSPLQYRKKHKLHSPNDKGE